jgi:dCMP deaminase
MKRHNYHSKDESFLLQAIGASLKSHDYQLFREGAALCSSDNRLIGIGYNGFPRIITQQDVKTQKAHSSEFMVGAAENAIYNALARNLTGTTLYCTHIPCPPCTYAILQTGIQRIIYANDKHLQKGKDWAKLSEYIHKIAKRKDVIFEKYNGPLTFDLTQPITNFGEKHMLTAAIAAQRSKDPSTQVGALIVDQHGREIGSGYNGFATGIDDNEFPWGDDAQKEEDTKRNYVIHAEKNAILNTPTPVREMIKGGRAYLTHYPSHHATQVLIQAGIRYIYWESENPHISSGQRAASEKMITYLDKKDIIKVRRLERPDIKEIKIE